MQLCRVVLFQLTCGKLYRDGPPSQVEIRCRSSSENAGTAASVAQNAASPDRLKSFRPGRRFRTKGIGVPRREGIVNWSHFGMTRRPFRPAVDTAAYYPAAAHEAALAAVSTAFARREAVALIDGPPG